MTESLESAFKTRVNLPVRIALGVAMNRKSTALALIVALGFAAVASAQTTAPTASPSPQPNPCGAPENRQFDFWVGRWDVYATGTNRQVARSLIESVYAGCGVRENWAPLRGGGGGSLSLYLPGRMHWRQTWIDSSGSLADFTGGWNGKAMVIEGDWPAPTTPEVHNYVRMTYTPNADGSVRQSGEASPDNKTWTPSFDFTYRPAKV